MLRVCFVRQVVIFLGSFVMLLCVGVGSARLAAQDNPGTASEVKKDAAIELHKVGSFNIQRKSLPIELYTRAALGYGVNVAAKFAPNIRTISRGKQIDYQVVVPKGYTEESRYGVFVFISSSDRGKLAKPWLELLADRKMIAISANDSGNKVGSEWRTGMAAFAVRLIDEGYNIDYDRIYVSGVSGGGRAASVAMMTFQDVFTGGIPIAGANPVLPMKNADSSGSVYTDPGTKTFNFKSLQIAATTGRYAFVTGEKDYNNKNVQLVAQGYQAGGFQFVNLLVEPGKGHGLCSAEWLGKALDFLDGPLSEIAKVRFKSAKKEFRKQPGLSSRYYQASAMHATDPVIVEEAEAKLIELGEAYQEALEKTQAKVMSAKSKAAFKLLEKLAGKWGEVAAADVAEMYEEIKARDP